MRTEQKLTPAFIFYYRPNCVLRAKIDFSLAFSMQHYRCTHSEFILFISKLMSLSVHTWTNYSTNIQIPHSNVRPLLLFLFVLQVDLIERALRNKTKKRTNKKKKTVYNVAHLSF